MFVMWRQQAVSLLHHQFGCQSPAMFSTCAWRNYSSSYASIESSKHMQKLLTRKGAKTKRKWYQPHIAEPMELTGKNQRSNKKGVSEAQGHRARQLSHVLYARICQIANTGELSEELLNKQVFFTKVKMHPTFSGINVYWDSNRSDAAEIETLLNGLSGKLRSLLISYHVLGRIPAIIFVKDRSKGDLTRLNQLFEIADYGPDYFPSPLRDRQDMSIQMSDEIVAGARGEIAENILNQELSTLSLEKDCLEQTSKGHLNDGLEMLSSEAGWKQQASTDVGDAVTAEDPFSFRSNLYGLPRNDLMKKVLAQRKKTKYQRLEDDEQASTSVVKTDSQLKDFIKLRSKMKDKEKLLRQRDSTKLKQKLLEQEFDDVQDLFTVDKEVFDNDVEYDDSETHERS
ncbi:hypothetical protein PoB_001951100 [Plakobranchus ocellatus]|uniref:Ribosome-binding factor A, mitochondrial n=1 Tax=Plakobranchus ocellatus TaxID=259542 RepID=A0AAV3Z107_9GAST|nr:hypothetical protein PoB_001951100 [Plakobranchus ocellatus]